MAKSKEKALTALVTGPIVSTFLNVSKPKPGPRGGEALFSLCGLVAKDDTATQEKFERAKLAALELGKPLWGGEIPENLDYPLRDGDAKGGRYPEFRGHFYFNAKSKFKPGLVDANGEEILDPDQFYSGVIVRVSLNLYPYSAVGNRGIGVGLNNVMKVADGKRLAGRGNPADDFTQDDEEALLA
jgi:hypothetical protein